MTSDGISSFGTKESQVQREETTSIATRPSVSASSSRGTFSCRRWRLLSGKPRKDDGVLDSSVSTHKSTAENVQYPTIATLDSNNWATAATPFAAFLPRDTIVPTISRKSVAAAVLTSVFPPENAKKWEREMTICKRKHVKVTGRMATRIYRSKNVQEDAFDTPRRQKWQQKKTLKDQIYLPVLSQTQRGHLQPFCVAKSPPSLQYRNSGQDQIKTVVLPDALAGMKFLSSQFNELRARLEETSTAHRIPESHSNAVARNCSTQTFSPLVRSRETDNSFSSLDSLSSPSECSDGYQADEEESTSDEMETNFLESESTNNSEDELLFLLNALDLTS